MRPDWKVTVTRPGESPATRGAGLAQADDRALVQAAVSGSREAFGLIVERHRRAIYQLCYRYVGRHEDASDLAQDVFLRAYRGLPRFKGESSIGTWLYRIGVNVCLNRLSARTADVAPLGDADAVSDGDDPARALVRSEQSRRVRRAIAGLPKRQRTVLLLRVYQELSHQEIARIVGSSVGAVKANFFHALANLRKRLQEP